MSGGGSRADEFTYANSRGLFQQLIGTEPDRGDAQHDDEYGAEPDDPGNLCGAGTGDFVRGVFV